MKRRGQGSSLPGWSQLEGDFGAVRAIVSLFAQASLVAQAHGKGPPATRSRKAELWRPPQAGHRVDCPRKAT
jgi:hypothetical protein